MRKNKIILLMLLFIGINLVLIQNVDASTSKSTYTIVYNSNGGKGKLVTQKCKRNKYVNLIGNTYKKEGSEGKMNFPDPSFNHAVQIPDAPAGRIRSEFSIGRPNSSASQLPPNFDPTASLSIALRTPACRPVV